MQKLTQLRKLAEPIGWKIRKLRNPVRGRTKMVRYTLWNHLSDVYCANLQEVEEKIRRGLKRGPNGHGPETNDLHGLR